jgi:taurine dioxygenase
MTVSTALDVRPLSAVIGAEVHGVDVREADDATIAALRATLLRHRVIFLPGQHLTPDEHSAFAARFGEPTPAHPVIRGMQEHPEIFQIDYTVKDALPDRDYGLGWHTDVTFVERPPMGSILNAITIPAAGGDTCWSSQIAAYAGLSEAMQRFLATLTAVHDGSKSFGPKASNTVHPVVHTHPETGERGLFVNPGFTQRIVELSKSESESLLRFLYNHATKPEYTVRYHWTAGDIGFWDNRSTMHSVVGDYAGQPRVIQRITLHGQAPRLAA